MLYWLCGESIIRGPLGHSGPLKAQQGLGVGLGWRCGPARTPSLFTHQFQAEPCRCSRRVALIIERIDLSCASNPMWVLNGLTGPRAIKGAAR